MPGVPKRAKGHPLDLVVDGLLQLLEPAVAGNVRHGVVEEIVQVLVAHDVRFAFTEHDFFHLNHDFVQLFQIDLFRLVHRQGYGEAVEGKLEGVDFPDIRLRELGDENPPPRFSADQAPGFQNLEGLPQGRAADPEAAGDFLLLDLLAGLEPPLDDHVFKVLYRMIHNGFDLHGVWSNLWGQYPLVISSSAPVRIHPGRIKCLL